MSADAYSDMDGDDGKQDGELEQGADSSAVDTRPGETPDRTEHYETLQAAGQQQISADGHPGRAAEVRRSSAWDEVPEEYRASRPGPDSLSLSPERATHILDGDQWGGGHRSGTGRPEKTEFPASWADSRIIEHVTDVARYPDVPPVLQANHRWRASGERDGVGITVIVQPDGGIWAAWPDEGSPGIVRSPKEGQP
jgi:hypothetical protein